LIELFSKNSLWFFCYHEIQFNQDGTFGSYVVTTPIKREKSDETLDIWFNTANEAIDYARANHLFIIVTDDEHN